MDYYHNMSLLYTLMLVTLAINVHIFDAKLKKVMLCYIKIFKYLPFAEE